MGNAPQKRETCGLHCIHPKLCATDGDGFLTALLEGNSTDELYVGACDPVMQQKMFRGAFEASGFDKAHFHGVEIRNMDTNQAVEAIKKAISG